MSVIVDKVAHHVCKILINRPAKRNSLNLETIKSLRDALRNFEDHEYFHVAILGGVGGNFCAGYDLNEIVDTESAMPNIKQIEQMLWPLSTRLSEKKIIIAAIDGHAAGFGFELALKCDFRVADRDSRMGFMNRRFGIPILNGGTVILPKLVGLARSMELVATGKAQLALEALQYGTITYISDIGCALGRATNFGRCLAKFYQPSLIHDLKSMTSQRDSREIELLHLERIRSLEYLQHCEPLVIVSKFLNGELGRHGSFDMGNLIEPEPEVTL